MTRTDLASPTEGSLTGTPDLTRILADPDLLKAFTSFLEYLANATASPAYLELKCFTPAEAGVLLGKSENWVVEAIRDGRIPFTYVGRTPRLTAAHIREIQAEGEVKPSNRRRSAKKRLATAA